MVREIILGGLSGTELLQHVEEMTSRLIPDSHQSAFEEDIIEDLEQMDESRLVGLGITAEQLKAWQRLNN